MGIIEQGSLSPFILDIMTSWELLEIPLHLHHLPQASAYALMHSCAATLGPGQEEQNDSPGTLLAGSLQVCLYQNPILKCIPQDYGKESDCEAGNLNSIPGSGRSSEEGNGNPVPVSLSEKSHGQRSLVDYSP